MRWSGPQSEGLLLIALLQLVVILVVARMGHLLLRRLGRPLDARFEYSRPLES